MKKFNLAKITFLVILMAGFVFFTTSCGGNNTKSAKSGQNIEKESPAEKEAAKEEENADKQIFKEKVAMFSQMDEDKNGVVDKSEFLKFSNESEFAKKDKNNDGKITKDEYISSGK